MMLELLINIQVIWMVFVKVLVNTIQKNPCKILIVFDLSHKNLSNKSMVSETLDRNISILIFLINTAFLFIKNFQTSHDLVYYKILCLR